MNTLHSITCHFGQVLGRSLPGLLVLFWAAVPATASQTKVSAPDGATVDLFGTKVAISGDTAVAGAPGHDHLGTDFGGAFVYVRAGAAWTQQAKLTPPGSGAWNTWFGCCVIRSDAGIADGGTPAGGVPAPRRGQ